MEKSSLFSSYPIVAGELLARGPMKHGFGVPDLPAFAAKVGYRGFQNSSDMQWISWISCESTVNNSFFCDISASPSPNDEIGIRNDIAKSDLVLECVAKYSVVAAESLAILRQLIGQVQELLELYGGTLPPLFLLITFFSFNLHRHTTPGF
nr:uncharacterized protein LOC109149839 isoform X2 [Ipomoea batatas]